MPNQTIEVPVHLLTSIYEILSSLDYEISDTDEPKSFFFGKLNEDSFFYDKNKLEEILKNRK
jgi:hypothetical protein